MTFSHLAGRRSLLALLATLVGLTVLLTGAYAQTAELTGPSPARGHAQVIAQGMTAPAAERVAWRVVDRTIPVRRDARPSDRMAGGAGFLVADGTPLFITDQKTKIRLRLAPGEAEFVPAGANQSWASLSDEAASAYTLELVARDQADRAQDGELIYRSSAFAMPQGDYDIDLVRDVLDPNERTALAAGEYPIVILVTAGEIEVRGEDPDATRVNLKRGEARAFTGELIIRARGERSASFVAPVIGASIGGGVVPPPETDTPDLTPTPEATATPEETAEPAATAGSEETTEAEPRATARPRRTPEPTAAPAGRSSLTLDVRVCPAGMRPETLDGDACTGLERGYEVALVGPRGRTLRATRVSDVTLRWGGLAEGTYRLLINRFPAGYDGVSLDGYVCCSTESGYTLAVGPDAELLGTLYFFLPAPAAAQQAVSGSGRVDSDGDGLTDQEEINIYGTHPNVWDTDGDGVNDSNEIEAGSSPFDPTSY